MNQHPKKADENEPLIIRLGDDDDYGDDGEFDDGEVEVIRPNAPKAPGQNTRGRGLRDQAAEAKIEEELPPSKTKIKKQMHELRDFGAELVNLSKDQLAQLDLPDNLRDAIRDMKNINKFGAQRRQIQYIGKLMREIDIAPIVAKLNVWNGTSQTHIAYMHQLERWRERLMANDSALTELLAAYPEADAQRLRTLIRNAHKEQEGGKPPKNFRELFQVLKDIIPEQG
jgi:ribosome-associated protein